MSYSISEVTATGGNTFNIPFDYIAQSEIAVFVDGVSTSFTFTSANVIDITPAPTSGALVRIKRTTSLTDRTVDFQSGAVLTEEDLDNSNIQVFHAAQEAIDAASESISVGLDGKWDAQVDSVNRAIKNVADPTDAQDVVTKNWAETGMSSQLATATAKASEASSSASSASASETAAASSSSTASTKASEASVSAANAAVSATNAAQSSASAATSATNAATSATNASTSESNASSDATTASNAASTATSQASVASSAATTATSQATSATNSANAAASSESNASTSATNAATSATSASTSASQAQGYRDTTLGYKDSAAASATGALSSKNAAATSETNAAASESSVAVDASTATTKASEAATSASNAATSATNAASSASAAAQSAIDAADAAGFDPADFLRTPTSTAGIVSADDLDTFTTDGIYSWAGQTPANRPGTDQYGILLVCNDASQPNQFVFGGIGSNGALYHRRRNSGTWQAWKSTDMSKADIDALNIDAATLDNLNSTAFGRLATASDWTKTQSYNRVTLTDAATINWNMATSPSAIVSLSANRTMGNPTNIKAGNWYTLRIYHSGAPRTLAWSSYWRFGGNGAPELSTLANDYDVLTFYAFSTTALSFVGIATNIAAV